MLNHEKHTMVQRKLAFGKQLRNAQNLENLSVLSYVMVNCQCKKTLISERKSWVQMSIQSGAAVSESSQKFKSF